MMLCLLPADDIKHTFVNHLEHQEFPEFLSTLEALSLVEFKEYFKDQWIKNTEPKFLSNFGTKINSNNALETYNMKLNAHVGSKQPNIWLYMEIMNEMLDDAVIDLKFLQKYHKKSTKNK